MANVPSLSVVRDTAKPKKLGRYELEECLGAEAGRETYRARVRGLAGFDRVFIVKCFRRRPGVAISRTDPILLTAKRSTSVTDPRVARVLEADVIDGAAVVVTEFVQGLDLDRFREWAQVSGELAVGTDPSAENWQRRVAYLGAEIAGALAAMHGIAAPLVHGGLSPRNVIVTARGGIKILDAGLGMAAQKGGDAPSARAHAYAAPGPPGAEPTVASDVRALGAMIFELATGEPPQPGMTSAAARRMLEPLWPPMAEFIASMLAEDPSLRPRATRVAEVMAGVWAGIPEATMATDLAALVQNFSAFVADGAQGTGTPAPALEPPEPEPISSSASGILTVAPPAPSANSGSFFAVSDQATRVSPDGNYADALFQALSSDSGAPSPASPPPAVPSPPLAHGPASSAPPRGMTMRSFSTVKPAEILASRAMPSHAPGAAHQAALPVLSSGPLARDAAMPSLPPAPLVKPPVASTILLAPAPAPGRPRATMAASPPPPPGPPLPSGVVAMPPAEPAPEPVTDEFSDAIPAEPLPEAVDWGAQALAALGTQAGIQIALVPSERDAAALAAMQPAAESVSDPAIEEAFALAPLPPPPNAWNETQPVSSGARMSPIQAPAPEAPARSELLEEELLEDEPTPLLVSTNGGAAPAADPDYAAEAYPTEAYPTEGYAAEGYAAEGYAAGEAGEAQATEYEPEPIQPTALEATAFAADDGGEFTDEPAPVRVPQAMSATAARGPSASRSRSALKSRKAAITEGEDELFQPSSSNSRAKKVAIVLLAAAGLGAGAAALVLGPLGAKRHPAPVAMPGKSPPKKAIPGPAQATAPTEKAAVADKDESQPAGKAAAKAIGKPSLAESKGKAAEAKPSSAMPIGKPSAGKSASAVPPTGKDKAAVAVAPAVLEAPAKAKPVVADKPPGAVSQPAPTAPMVARAVPAGGSVRVRVTSQPPGARVWVNGEERGDTPCSIDIKAGTARVALVHAGFLTSQATVEIGEGTKIDESLKPVEPPMTGEARFRAECQTTGKLPIVVDGKETGILCPFSKMRVDPGNHNIGLLNPGTGKIHQKEVTLSPGVRSVVFQD
jgi:serine/threonine protein kinase